MGLPSANRKPRCPSCCMFTIVLANAMALLTTTENPELWLQVSAKIKHYEVNSGYFIIFSYTEYNALIIHFTL
jgi:hypothetical protein